MLGRISILIFTNKLFASFISQNIYKRNRKTRRVILSSYNSLRPRPKFEIIKVCETQPMILYSDVAIFPNVTSHIWFM